MRHAIITLALLLSSVVGAQVLYDSAYNDSRARRAIDAEPPLQYDKQQGIMKFPTYTPTVTPTITLTPTVTHTPTPTPTIVWPLEQGGTNNGALTNSAPNQVLRVIGGKIQNDVIPQASINSSFAIYVDPIFGTDSPDCGPLNKPCRSITGADGAHDKILAANDNGAYVCDTDPSQACTRCSAGANAGQVCNEDSDCPGGICSVLACLSNGTTCHKLCSTSDIMCDLDSDCPSGETCSRQAPGQCSNCGGWPVSICPSGGKCNILNRKTYNIMISAGKLTEWIGNSCNNSITTQCIVDSDCPSGGACVDTQRTSVPKPGYLYYIGSGRNITDVRYGSTISTVYVKGRKSVYFKDLNITNYASSGDSVRIDGDSYAVLIDSSGLIYYGNGWGLNVNGKGNTTIVLVRTWLYGFSSNASSKGVRYEIWPSSVCSNLDSRPCFSSADCPSGGTCITSGVASNDFGVQESFIQAGVKAYSDDDANILFDAKACGANFNLFVWNNFFLNNVARGEYRPAVIKLKQSSCDSGAPALLKDRLSVYMGNNIINKTEFGANIPMYYSVDVGQGTTLNMFGINSYDACRRNVQGKLRYVDDTSGQSETSYKFGGGMSFLGSIRCDAPQTTRQEPPVVSLSYTTTGGNLGNGTYCYQATGLSQYGEGLPGSPTCITTSGCSGSCRITVTITNSNGATGYKVYGRPNSANGTYGLLATLNGYANNVYYDTGAATPGAAPPTQDSSYITNPVNGEMWVSTNVSPPIPKFFNQTVGVATLPLVSNPAINNAGTLKLFDLSGNSIAEIADNTSSVDIKSLRGDLRLFGTSGQQFISCSQTTGKCSVTSPQGSNDITNKQYVDTPTKTITIGPGAFTLSNACTLNDPDVSQAFGYRYIECPDSSTSQIVTSLPAPDGWNGQQLTIRMNTIHRESGSTLSYDWSCSCVQSGATSQTYGSAVTLSTTSGSSSMNFVASNAAQITCGGTCNGSAQVFLRGTINDTSSSWTNAPRFIGLELKYGRSTHSD